MAEEINEFEKDVHQQWESRKMRRKDLKFKGRRRGEEMEPGSGVGCWSCSAGEKQSQRVSG